jgi:hypothetical protein
VTGLVHFQSVQLGPQPQQLPCQLPVLSLHLPLRPRGGVSLLDRPPASLVFVPFGQYSGPLHPGWVPSPFSPSFNPPLSLKSYSTLMILKPN